MALSRSTRARADTDAATCIAARPGDRLASQDNDSQFRLLAESMPQLVWTTRPDGWHDYFNGRWYEFTGLDPDLSLGEGWSSVIHPDDRPLTRERWRQALASGGPYEIEYRIRGADGTYRWFLGRALPVRRPDGAILRWFGTCTDINAQKTAEEALRRLHEQHRLALDAAELGTWDYSVASDVVSWDERSSALFGLADGIRSLPLEETFAWIDEADRARIEGLVRTALDPASDGRYDAEYRIVLGDSGVRWLHARGQTAFAGEGPERQAVRLSGVVADVTARRASEEAQHLLTRELNHRVKNLFAIASGMVSMTARTAKTPKDMADALRGRLGALSRAHELVRPALGAPHQPVQATTIDMLAAAILAPYAVCGERLVLEGPAVPVGSQTTTSLALVLHELATNAAKYGCLSAPDGRLAIRWSLRDDVVDLIWSEAGGPPVAAEPSSEGFGSQLARKSITGQLGGALDQDWQPSGLVVRMTLPLDRLSR
ncbi:MAG TPA: PAS domain-containing protein [Microvirga sp.]|nr:PAS domain-containing protein [Microvirga sp.]